MSKEGALLKDAGQEFRVRTELVAVAAAETVAVGSVWR